MSAESAALASLLLQREIEDFLYREADLLDARRFDEWLALFTEDARYWMPMRRNVPSRDGEREFTREGADVSWFDEGKDTLARRVAQLATGLNTTAQEQTPRFWDDGTTGAVRSAIPVEPKATRTYIPILKI